MFDNASAHIALATFDFRIPFADSLKSKRRVVKSIKDRMRARFNASIAEIGCQEEWQRAVLGVAMISNDKRRLEQGYSALNHLLEGVAEIRLVRVNLEWL